MNETTILGGNKKRGPRFLAPVIAGGVLFLILFSNSRSAPPAGWLEDVDAGFAQARAEHKNIVMAFNSHGCAPCSAMDRTVLSAQVVQAALTQFVPIRVDAFNRRDLMDRYDVAGTPSYVVATPDGQPLAQTMGFQPVEEFLRFLKEASAKAKETASALPSQDAEPTPSGTESKP